MLTLVLSYGLAALAAVVIWLGGNLRFGWSWSLGLASEGFWVWYALRIHQYALIGMSFIYAAAYARNLWKMRCQSRT